MSCVGSVENGASPVDGLMRQTVMDHSRREKSQSGMAVLVVVPGEEILREGASILEGSKTLREARSIFQSPEVAFRIRVVVGNVRATVGFGDPQIRHQESNRFGGHGRSPVRMDRQLSRLDRLF